MIPRYASELDADALSALLAPRHPGVRVREVEVQVGDFPGTQRSAISDNTKRLAITGPCKVPWEEGMRQMVRARS